ENSGAFSNGSCEEDLPEFDYEAAAARTPIVSVSDSRRAKRRAKAETAAAQSRAQRDRSDLTRAQRDKNDLKDSLARVKAGMQETAASDDARPGSGRGAEILRQMDQKEQERLVREVLSEFLSH
ncbi:MAG: hypothetical protein LUI07_03190, partial [Lachnospiraceae bacterium]|nr:hypothetical protein [Lachnospiraceae bacterium]